MDKFNGHQSHVNVKPKSCELAQYFHGNKECNINRDLNVYILQDNVTGPRNRREYFEDRWIIRLDTKAPHKMNTNLKHFAKIHYELFEKNSMLFIITSNNFYKHLYLSMYPPSLCIV